MHALDFLRGPALKTIKPVYALAGDDVYMRREATAAIVRAALGTESDELAVARFAGDHASLADVLDELRTLPFLAPRRVAIVENADPFVTAHRKELEGYAEAPATSGTLVLQVKTWPATTRLAKLVARIGQTVDCKAVREQELPDWLIQLARDRDEAEFDPDAARLLIELVGPEVGVLASEVAKLAVYVGDRRRIGRDDVVRMVGAGRVETIWRVLDAATTGRAEEAIDLLDRLLTSGEHPVGLLAAIAASLRKVHHAGQLRKARREHRDACAQAGILPFAVETTRRQHAHLGPDRVDRLPAMLLQADLDLKGMTALAPSVVLERFLLELAQPRRGGPPT